MIKCHVLFKHRQQNLLSVHQFSEFEHICTYSVEKKKYLTKRCKERSCVKDYRFTDFVLPSERESTCKSIGGNFSSDSLGPLFPRARCSNIFIILLPGFQVVVKTIYKFLRIPTLPTYISRFIVFIFLNLRTSFVNKISN